MRESHFAYLSLASRVPRTENRGGHASLARERLREFEVMHRSRMQSFVSAPKSSISSHLSIPHFQGEGARVGGWVGARGTGLVFLCFLRVLRAYT